MFIQKIEVEGFRGYRDYHRFEFGSNNEITGGNGLGKSSIAEIISFGIAGVDKHGKERAADRLMNQHCNECRIIIHGEANGRSFVIERHVVKLKGKTENRLLLNGVQSPQDMIDSVIGNRRHFIASFLPKFLLGMTDKELEQEIVPLVPIPKQEDVIALLAEDDPVSASLLEGVNLLDPNHYIKTQSAYLKEQEEELIRLGGSLDEVNATLETEIPSEIEIDMSEIESLKETIAAIETAKPKLQDTSELERHVLSLTHENDRLQKGLNFEERLINCPNCGHEINLDPDLAQKNESISAKMASIVAEMKEAKEHIEEIKEANKAALETFNQANAENLVTLRSDLKVLESNLEVTKNHNIRVALLKENIQKAKARKREVIDQKLQASNVIESTKKLIKAVKAYNIKRCEMQMQSISIHLNRASIRLFELVKSTGEMKPAFKAEFDGKEVRLLSTSEEILCFLEFSHLVRNLTNSNYPVFVDCAESIEGYEKPDVQLFEARVVPGQSLQINGEEVIND